MLSQIQLREWARAVLHELYRRRVRYILIGSCLLTGMFVLSVFYSERYTVASIIRFESSSASKEDLRQYIFSEAVKEQVYRSLNQIFSSVDHVHGTLSKSLSLELSGETLVYLRFTSTDKHNALSVMQVLEKALTSNDELEASLLKHQQKLSQLLKQKDSLQLEKDAQIEQIAYSKSRDLKTGVSNVDSRVGRLEEQLQQTEIELQVLGARLTSLEAELSTEKNKIAFASQYTEAEKAFEESLKSFRQNEDELEQLRFEYARLMEGKKNKAQRNAAIALEQRIRAQENSLVLSQKDHEVNKQRLLDLREDPRYLENIHSANTFYQQLQQQYTLTEIERRSLREKRQALITSLEEQKGSLEEKQEHFISVINVEQNITRVSRDLEDLEQQIEQVQGLITELSTQKKPYAVYQNAVLPTQYNGIGIREILMLGPFLAVGIPFLLAFFSVLIDSRIRTPSQLRNYLPAQVPILEDIPHYNSPMGSRGMRNTLLALFMWSAAIFCLYLGLSTLGLNV